MSTRQGSGVGVLLVSPHGERMHLSVRLDYKATNNEADYEALIAGLQAARHVGASNVLIHSDSQLAAQQLSVAFEIRNVRLKLYAEAFAKLRVDFREVVVQKIPRSANQAADELAKLLDHEGGSWVDELPGILWALRTTPKEGTGATPFHLVYGGEAIVPVEVGIESDRIKVYDENNAERRHLELDLVDETRAKAVVWLMAYRQRMKQNYNRRAIPRSFQVGDLVYKKVKPVGDVTKLGAPWGGPFKIVEKFRSGAYYLEDEDGRKLERSWSANHLQPYRAG
ncbi:uncharacterized protein LOC122014139 [Zingiber officinale]|uniref:uncharacterized protein LOC122014139 n=1 Tax=Zingiber officinale TaxID=94328 RepID=UPI001C4D59ED|nr:uncharacterized protein LOC122014139 [Zingiber officinale]